MTPTMSKEDELGGRARRMSKEDDQGGRVRRKGDKESEGWLSSFVLFCFVLFFWWNVYSWSSGHCRLRTHLDVLSRIQWQPRGLPIRCTHGWQGKRGE